MWSSAITARIRQWDLRSALDRIIGCHVGGALEVAQGKTRRDIPAFILHTVFIGHDPDVQSVAEAERSLKEVLMTLVTQVVNACGIRGEGSGMHDPRRGDP